MVSKWISLNDAASRVTNGMTLALGGMTLNRRPVAFVRRLLQREKPPSNLTLVAFTAGYAADLLVGAGCVSSVRTAYFGLEAFGLAPMFTEKANQGQINIIEESETSLVLGLRAHIAGVGFMPSRAWQNTDMLSLRPDVQTILDPYTKKPVSAFPAIAVDVTVLHGLAADEQGNVAINNNLAIDQLLTYAADTVIATVERRIDKLTPRDGITIIPAAAIHYIAIASNGAYPTSCYPDYALNGHALITYSEECAAGKFTTYLEQFKQGEV